MWAQTARALRVVLFSSMSFHRSMHVVLSCEIFHRLLGSDSYVCIVCRCAVAVSIIQSERTWLLGASMLRQHCDRH